MISASRCGNGYSRDDFLEMIFYNYMPEIILPDGSKDENELGNFLLWSKWLMEGQKISEGNREHRYFEAEEYVTSECYNELTFMPLQSMEDFSGLSAANMASFWGTDLREIDGIFFPEGLLAVNNRSKNPELAGRFIRAAFSFEMQTEYTGGSGFPVNGRAFAEGFENQQEENQKRKERETSPNYIFFWSERTWHASRMYQIIKSVEQPRIVNTAILEILLEESQDYFDGKEYLWDCCARILKRIP